MKYSDNIENMWKHASKVHKDANQLYDFYQYSYHLRMVLDAVMNFAKHLDALNDNIEILAFGACFHDSIEDARLTYNDVLKIAKTYFNEESDAISATEIVYALTNEKGRTRDERANDKYYAGICETPFAPFVKACDRYANYMYACSVHSSMEKRYNKEMNHFLEKITVGDKEDDCFKIPQELITELTKNID
jgi:hypothetical protein